VTKQEGMERENKQTTSVAVGDGNILAVVFQGMSDGAAELRVRYLHHINATLVCISASLSQAFSISVNNLD